MPHFFNLETAEYPVWLTGYIFTHTVFTVRYFISWHVCALNCYHSDSTKHYFMYIEYWQQIHFRPLCFILSGPVTQQPTRLTESANSSSTTSTANEFSTNGTEVTWTRSANVTDTPSPSYVRVTTGDNVTSYTNDIQTSVTSSPDPHSETYHHNSSNKGVTPTHTFSSTFPLSNQTVAGNLATSYGYTESRSTEEARNESMPHTEQPEVDPSTSQEENSTMGYDTENSDSPASTPIPINRITVVSKGEGKHSFTVNC